MSVWPAWEVREEGGATVWFHVRLGFSDGARVDALAVLSGGCVTLEEVRARPSLSVDDLAVLADWIEGPLGSACGADAGPSWEGAGRGRRARPAWPRGVEGSRRVAQEYRIAQSEGLDPVLAVMGATGHSRRRSLRLIAQARDAGFLTSRHARR
ncbi:DUF6214 family protein [Streptomyces cadmiisoli]|uniref:DUF6214 family protein n=1 Tax=Streptomyces cadmiisoli TaxID=2184053 RepID=UPI00364B0B4E